MKKKKRNHFSYCVGGRGENKREKKRKEIELGGLNLPKRF